jgi:hypothetical protein
MPRMMSVICAFSASLLSPSITLIEGTSPPNCKDCLGTRAGPLLLDEQATRHTPGMSLSKDKIYYIIERISGQNKL